MITRAELLAAAQRESLQNTTIEKDYILGWMLYGIARHPRLSRWMFKGGTCLTRELIMIEEAGGGPAFDVDRHALEVSSAVRYLQTHLERVCDGKASEGEQRAVGAVVKAVRVARVRRG